MRTAEVNYAVHHEVRQDFILTRVEGDAGSAEVNAILASATHLRRAHPSAFLIDLRAARFSDPPAPLSSARRETGLLPRDRVALLYHDNLREIGRVAMLFGGHRGWGLFRFFDDPAAAEAWLLETELMDISAHAD